MLVSLQVQSAALGSSLTVGVTDVGSTGTNVSLNCKLGIVDLDLVSYGTDNHIDLRQLCE